MLRTFFSFEPELWLESFGAKLELQPLERHPANPVIPRGGEGAPDAHRADFAHVMPEDGRLRAWYETWSEDYPGMADECCNIAYAESDDGVAWRKPSFDYVRRVGKGTSVCRHVHVQPE